MKLVWPRKGWIWKGPLAVLVLLFAMTVVTARHGNQALYPAANDTVTVYILNNGFHTDIVLPAKEVWARGGVLAKAGQAAGDKSWLIYGWGDAGFYSASGTSIERAFDGMRALFAPNNPSVIRVWGIDSDPGQAWKAPDVVAIRMSRAGFNAMADSMDASFVTKDGAPVTDKVTTPGNPFFTSHQHFSIIRLCNNWTGDQLHAAGLPTTPMIDGLAPLLALDLSLRAKVR
ncbi:hypothetical protein ABI_18520 [Asticcacaulis biprosthecium C19]|uniref:DUF2459 domain-containing protein n=1 Tax=Asticcacaulis biprosthecium C19 TaxID=715226 RepID=F4QL37_9CAUL|nr:DUF2459 domain-containing protein [Asticcacaulis biprosthecium]EGF93412.1 hypothetical protein ABI_18520 [Asticcacaulis biprosthecium C19]